MTISLPSRPSPRSRAMARPMIPAPPKTTMRTQISFRDESRNCLDEGKMLAKSGGGRQIAGARSELIPVRGRGRRNRFPGRPGPPHLHRPVPRQDAPPLLAPLPPPQPGGHPPPPPHHPPPRSRPRRRRLHAVVPRPFPLGDVGRLAGLRWAGPPAGRLCLLEDRRLPAQPRASAADEAVLRGTAARARPASAAHDSRGGTDLPRLPTDVRVGLPVQPGFRADPVLWMTAGGHSSVHPCPYPC